MLHNDNTKTTTVKTYDVAPQNAFRCYVVTSFGKHTKRRRPPRSASSFRPLVRRPSRSRASSVRPASSALNASQFNVVPHHLHQVVLSVPLCAVRAKRAREGGKGIVVVLVVVSMLACMLALVRVLVYQIKRTLWFERSEAREREREREVSVVGGGVVVSIRGLRVRVGVVCVAQEPCLQ